MLKKLLKHEIRATSRIMLPLFAAVLIAALGANISIRTLLKSEYDVPLVFGFLLITVFAVSIAAVCIVAFGLMIYRFYRNLLQDEGHVMLTLPVSLHQHIWSKLLSTLLWYAATALCIAASILLLCTGTGFLSGISGELVEIVEGLPGNPLAVHAVPITLELLLLVFFGAAVACMEFYAAMAIGHSFANHKLLLSAVVFFGIRLALQLLGGLLAVVIEFTGIVPAASELVSTWPQVALAYTALGGLNLLYIAFFGAYYFLTVYFMGKRLNLA